MLADPTWASLNVTKSIFKFPWSISQAQFSNCLRSKLKPWNDYSNTTNLSYVNGMSF